MCGLLDRESAKRSKLDDPGQFGVDLVQAIECVIQRENRYLVWRGDVFRLVDGYAGQAVASFVGVVTTRVIDRIRRMTCAATPKKCARFCQSTWRWSTSRM